MALKLSDKERFIIQAAWSRLEEDGFDEGEGWKRVKGATQIKRRRMKRWYMAAAVMVGVMVGFGGWWVGSDVPEGEREMADVCEIRRAEGVPVLTLADGKQVVLDGNASVQEIRQGGARVVLRDSTLSLSYVGDTLEGRDPEVAYNALAVPKGGEYSLTLADGSRVWLNAETTLRYPVNFSGDRREVELEGEAYFEIAPDALHPFCVLMKRSSVEVLGTHFNVSCYKNEHTWHTTLVEGKVKVNSGDKSFLLTPGKQFLEDRMSGVVEVKTVNVSLFTSWKDGRVVFQDERLEDIVGKLARWYDFEIFYADPAIKDLRFGGAINKYNSFGVVLRYLERTSGVRFDIDGKTVIARRA